VAIVTRDDAYYHWSGETPPSVCNGCSRPLPEAPRGFVLWAFQGAELTRGGKSLRVSADPDEIEAALERERLAAVLGDCSEDRPHVALCWPCALRIGRNLIEDGALIRYASGGYPYSPRPNHQILRGSSNRKHQRRRRR
jgi:hypothetical protein